jgi:pyrimidine operon attenuation protein/uracil phosphoribosyltransferase
MNSLEMEKTLADLAGQLLEKHGDCQNLALIGIQRRGVYLAARLAALLQARLKREIPQGVLDINLYRDDWTMRGPGAVVGQTRLFFEVEGMDLLLVDDVLFTGRTIRAALEALVDFGRPRKVELLALIDRGHRELPIQADYVGKTIDTKHDDHVDVLVSELDGHDEVLIN